MDRTIRAMSAFEATQAIWEKTLEEIQAGSLAEFEDVKHAFFAGAMSVFAMVDGSMDRLQETQKKAKLN